MERLTLDKFNELKEFTKQTAIDVGVASGLPKEAIKFPPDEEMTLSMLDKLPAAAHPIELVGLSPGLEVEGK